MATRETRGGFFLERKIGVMVTVFGHVKDAVKDHQLEDEEDGEAQDVGPGDERRVSQMRPVVRVHLMARPEPPSCENAMPKKAMLQ